MTDTILSDAETLRSLVDKCLHPYRYTLAQLDPRPKCEFCCRPAQGGDWRPEMCFKCAQDSLCENFEEQKEGY